MNMCIKYVLQELFRNSLYVFFFFLIEGVLEYDLYVDISGSNC